MEQLISGNLCIKFCRVNPVCIIRVSGVLYIELCQSVAADNILVMIDIYIECGKIFQDRRIDIAHYKTPP